MIQTLITLLESICPNNVYLQGSLNPNEAYPSEFITFWTDYTEDRAHYNNKTTSYDWNFSVIYYSDNPAQISTVPNTIITTLRNSGFISQGKGNNIASDEPTHTGWAMDFIKTEYITES